ncbi:MAG: hypothetical protein IJP68_09565 [Selenomonadaceae bacterium]|nr:hypothetical protein [Selenomonadaceae bacterium]
MCLDRNGVDFIINSDRYGLIPIQFKCSFGKPYRNFVIRRSRTSGAMTDFDKLTRAKRFGTIHPLFHCACFVDNNGDADIALAATDDLMKFVDNNLADIRAHENGTFLTCDWRRLEVHGVKVFRLDCRADFQKEENA